jgi:hypothetical protein
MHLEKSRLIVWDGGSTFLSLANWYVHVVMWKHSFESLMIEWFSCSDLTFFLRNYLDGSLIRE